jgi:hypothetical protein
MSRALKSHVMKQSLSRLLLTLNATGLNDDANVAVTVGSQTVSVSPTAQTGVPGM